MTQAKRRPLRPMRPHPARDKILAALAASSEPLSPKQLAEITSATIGATAYHVRTLHKAGVVELKEERRVRGAIEHLYGLVPNRDYLDWSDRAAQLLAACDALTVNPPDGALMIVEIDHQLQADLNELLAELKPSVERAVGRWLERASRQR